MIPIDDPGRESRSVYADILINSSTSPNSTTTNFSVTGGVRIKQSFATGQAAEKLANDAGVQEQLNKAAGTVHGRLERQKQLASDLQAQIATEIDRLPEVKLDAAGQAMRDTGLIDDANLATFKTTSSYAKMHSSKGIADLGKNPSAGDIAKVEKYLVLVREIK